MILTDSGEVAAVVDWELCTLGDPLADVGTLMAYWPDRDAADTAIGMPANLAPGFPTRDEIATRYAEVSGRDLSDSTSTRPRLLEAGDHPRGRLRPLRRRAATARRAPPTPASKPSPAWSSASPTRRRRSSRAPEVETGSRPRS